MKQFNTAGQFPHVHILPRKHHDLPPQYDLQYDLPPLQDLVMTYVQSADLDKSRVWGRPPTLS
jgi:hypothetical protein